MFTIVVSLVDIVNESKNSKNPTYLFSECLMAVQ